MIDIHIRELIPGFLMREKTGRAMAKAIERAFAMADETIQTGINTVLDVEKMPEWRLDEMAREYNLLYDFSADIDAKRTWIRDAIPMYRIYGTPEAIYQYLRGVFDDVYLEEWWQYPADPYHFRITVSGDWNDEKIAWAKRAVEAAKNLRSVCDDIALGSNCRVLAGYETAWYRFTYPMTGELMTGTWPDVSTVGGVANVEVKALPGAQGYTFGYPMTGTIPEPSVIGVISEESVRASPEGMPYKFSYPMTGPNTLAGTEPDISTVGGMDSAELTAETSAQGYVIQYPLCGTGITGEN